MFGHGVSLCCTSNIVSLSTLYKKGQSQNEKYLYFGKFAAKLDDLVNIIPSRLSGIFMIIATIFLRLNSKNAIKGAITWVLASISAIVVLLDKFGIFG